MKFLVDENVSHKIVKQLKLKRPNIDIVTIQELSLRTADDPTILEKAAELGAVLITRDKKTMIRYASDRVEAGLAMPGLIVIKHSAPIGTIVHDLEYFDGAGEPSDFENLVKHIPYQWDV